MSEELESQGEDINFVRDDPNLNSFMVNMPGGARTPEWMKADAAIHGKMEGDDELIERFSNDPMYIAKKEAMAELGIDPAKIIALRQEMDLRNPETYDVSRQELTRLKTQVSDYLITKGYKPEELNR